MLIGCIFLTSLCFSVLVEAVQTLIHIEHHDEMHFPLVILMVGAVGLLLNGFCYSLIGGYFQSSNNRCFFPCSNKRQLAKHFACHRIHFSSGQLPPRYRERRGGARKNGDDRFFKKRSETVVLSVQENRCASFLLAISKARIKRDDQRYYRYCMKRSL